MCTGKQKAFGWYCKTRNWVITKAFFTVSIRLRSLWRPIAVAVAVAVVVVPVVGVGVVVGVVGVAVSSSWWLVVSSQ